MVSAESECDGVVWEKFRGHFQARDIDREQVKLPAARRELMRVEILEVEPRRDLLELQLLLEAAPEHERLRRRHARIDLHAIRRFQNEITRELDAPTVHRHGEILRLRREANPPREICRRDFLRERL